MSYNEFLMSDDPFIKTLRLLQSYAIWALILLVIFSICYIPVYKKFKKKGISLPRQICCIGFCFSIFIILYATFMYVPLDFSATTKYFNLVPFKALDGSTEFSNYISEKILNIIVFIPFGFLLPAQLKRFRKALYAIVASATFTIFVEVTQYFGGRAADIDDVISNLLGAIIGYLFYVILDFILKNTKLWKKFNNTFEKEIDNTSDKKAA